MVRGLRSFSLGASGLDTILELMMLMLMLMLMDGQLVLRCRRPRYRQVQKNKTKCRDTRPTSNSEIEGYHWWNFQAAQCVQDVTVWIHERLLLQVFEVIMVYPHCMAAGEQL